MEQTGFRSAEREHFGLLATVEQRVLEVLARWMPAWISPDHLTLIGLIAMFLGGLFYFFSRWSPWYVHVVNFWLAVNWFGDSLDGTLARYRNKQRPRYGFFVDHMADTFGVVFLIGGLSLSPYLSEIIASWVLIAYFMLSINVYLAAYTLNKFRMSFWKVSPTELRIILAIANATLPYLSYIRVAGQTYLLFDVIGTVCTAAMGAALITSSIRNIRILYKSECI